jgi:hypothetical protein
VRGIGDALDAAGVVPIRSIPRGGFRRGREHLLAGVLTLLPAIQRSRERMKVRRCVFNLQQLGNSLAQYASLHPFLPYPLRTVPTAPSGRSRPSCATGRAQ